MKYILVIGDGMADNPVPQLGDLTPLQYVKKPAIDSLAAAGYVANTVNCPRELPPGTETGVLSIFGCDPLKYYTGRSPMEAAAVDVKLRPGDICFRANLVSLEDGGIYEEKKILSHSADSIAGEDALEAVDTLLKDPVFAALLQENNMELHPSLTYRPLLVWHDSDLAGTRFFPPHDHLGEACGSYLPAGSKGELFARLMRESNRILEHSAVAERRRAQGKLPVNGVWFWAEGTATFLPDFKERYGVDGAVVSAVPICHGIGALCGLEKIEVEGATGEIDTNFEGKLEATKAQLEKYDFVCLHLEAPDECTHNGDLPGKLQAIEWLDSKLVGPLTAWLKENKTEYRMLLLSDHKTLTSTRGHDGDPVPFLLYDSRMDTGRGGTYDEPAGCASGKQVIGTELLSFLFEQKTFTL